MNKTTTQGARMISQNFSIISKDDNHYYILRNGEPVGSTRGYSDFDEARKAVAQIQRWDRIVAL